MLKCGQNTRQIVPLKSYDKLMAKHMRPIAVLYQSPTFSHTLSVGHTLFSGCL